MKYYLSALKRYFDFKGRSSRTEYWYFFLFNFLVSFVIGIFQAIIENQTLVLLYSLFIMIPGISIAVRRIHDTDKSGWFILVPIYNIILLFIKGSEGDNRFGPSSKV